MCGAGYYFDVTTVGLIEPSRSRIVLTENQMFTHLLIWRPEARLRRQAQSARQTRGGDVGPSRFELAHDIAHVRDGIDEELDAQLSSKARGQIEFGPLRAVGAEIIGAGQIACDDAQLPTAQYLLHDT